MNKHILHFDMLPEHAVFDNESALSCVLSSPQMS